MRRSRRAGIELRQSGCCSAPGREFLLPKVSDWRTPVAGSAPWRSCKTVVVACVNPCAADAGAGKNTLRYAEMLSVVVPKASALKYDPLVPASWDNEQLRGWIEENVSIYFRVSVNIEAWHRCQLANVNNTSAELQH